MNHLSTVIADFGCLRFFLQLVEMEETVKSLEEEIKDCEAQEEQVGTRTYTHTPVHTHPHN